MMETTESSGKGEKQKQVPLVERGDPSGKGLINMNKRRRASLDEGREYVLFSLLARVVGRGAQGSLRKAGEG